MQGVVKQAESFIICEHIAIRAGKRSVLAEFTWRHCAGGIAWLIGTNGSGKSSLLRVLAGWQRPASGHVAWGHVRNGALRYFNPAMSGTADLRVRDFTAFVEALPNEHLDLRAAALFPITTAKRFGELSTGEAKRVLLWALLRDARAALVLDEPYEHLSRDAKASLTELLRNRATNNVVIVATNQEVPERETDTVLTFDGDRIEVTHAA